MSSVALRNDTLIGYTLLKIKSEKHDVTKKLKEIEHRYFHETGRNIFDAID